MLFPDIGGHTLDVTEIVVPEFGQPINTILSREKSFSGSGINKIDDLIRMAVIEEYRKLGLRVTINAMQLEMAKKGSLNIDNICLDTKQIVLNAFNTQAKVIETALMSLTKDNEYNSVPFSGGGSLLFKSFIKRWYPNHHKIMGPTACVEGLRLVAINLAKTIVKEAGYTAASRNVKSTLDALERMYG